jgi:hypothetical protein
MKTSREMRLLGQDPLEGFGNVGEGMAIQLTRDKRRVLWLAHESAPKNVTAVDVTNPKKPSVIIQTDLPHDKMRSNSLEVVGDTLVVAYQTAAPGLKPAGIEIFDVSEPAKPKTIGFFDASGPTSRGVHHLWFVDGHYIHCASGAADFTPRNPKDDPFQAKPSAITITRWGTPSHSRTSRVPGLSPTRSGTGTSTRFPDRPLSAMRSSRRVVALSRSPNTAACAR